MEFTSIEVGKPFPLFQDSNTHGINGCVFEVLDDGIFILVIYLNNMQSEEKKILKKKKIHVKVIEEDEFILPLMRFGDTELLFEIDFDPFLYLSKNDERFEKIGQSNMVNIISIESTNNIVQTMRWVNMPLKLYNKMIATWNTVNDLNYSKKYKNFINRFKRYGLLQLWNMGEYIGKMGER